MNGNAYFKIDSNGLASLNDELAQANTAFCDMMAILVDLVQKKLTGEGAAIDGDDGRKLSDAFTAYALEKMNMYVDQSEVFMKANNDVAELNIATNAKNDAAISNLG